GSAASNRAGGFAEFLRHSTAGGGAQHGSSAGRAAGVEIAASANQDSGVSEESVAGFAVAFGAVRRELCVFGNVIEHHNGDVYLPGEREYAVVYGGKDTRGS